MQIISRRKFITVSAGTVGLAGLSVTGKWLSDNKYSLFCEAIVDKVKLGNSGLTVSRIAMGTGTAGYDHVSNQTLLGIEKFVELSRHAYERGITFYDMADIYGSMPYIGEAIKSLPREKLTLLSKIRTYEDGSERNKPVQQILDRFRKETRTDYFDIMLMHCMEERNWINSRKHYMEGLAKAKQDGIVKAVGVSCHHVDALNEAAESSWVDVIMARINPFGTLMDAPVDVVKLILLKAIQKGKGVIGMKIFGDGQNASAKEREKSIQFVINEQLAHCMTMGFESKAQLNDAVGRVMHRVSMNNKR